MEICTILNFVMFYRIVRYYQTSIVGKKICQGSINMNEFKKVLKYLC